MASRFSAEKAMLLKRANREDIARNSAVSIAARIIIKVARGEELDAIIGKEFTEKGRLPAHLKDNSSDRTGYLGDTCERCFVTMPLRAELHEC